MADHRGAPERAGGNLPETSQKERGMRKNRRMAVIFCTFIGKPKFQ